MTDEQINIAIAESAGWERCGLPNGKPSEHQWRDPEGYGSGLHDFCNDLNSIHEVEKLLTTAQYWEYVDRCSLLVSLKRVDYVAHSCSATARQRAEAYLRTIGKWEDSE